MPLSSTGPESLEHNSAYIISPQADFWQMGFFSSLLSECANQIISQI